MATVWQLVIPAILYLARGCGYFFVNYLAILRVQSFDYFKLLHDTLMASSGVNPFDHSSVLMAKKVSYLSGSLPAFLGLGGKSSSEVIGRISADFQMLECLPFHPLCSGVAPWVFTTKNKARFLLNSLQYFFRLVGYKERP